jgi:Domain of unknown function (DUF4291)
MADPKSEPETPINVGWREVAFNLGWREVAFNSGRHILAQFDDDSVIVYQAYRPAIGHFAAKHGYFGGQFSLSRMSWVKPNFLWMMYRCGWASKEGQEVVLAVRLKRSAFDEILRRAVNSTFVPELYENEAAWKSTVAGSDVRLQWDPDHNPYGAPAERRAIQLGLRGEVLAKYAREWLLGIEDVSEFVRQQSEHARSLFNRLIRPREEIHRVSDPEVAARLGVRRRESQLVRETLLVPWLEMTRPHILSVKSIVGEPDSHVWCGFVSVRSDMDTSNPISRIARMGARLKVTD